MTPQPTLRTDRLALRPFALSDAPAVQQLAGAIEIAEMTLNVPHPYEDGMAEAWISTHSPRFAAGELANFAITHAGDELIGAIGLQLDPAHQHGDLGYWIGVQFWGRGFATEAARAILDYGFGALALNRIHASHIVRNPASGRVMQKLGMQYEGCLRQHALKFGRFEDVARYGILAGDPARAVRSRV